MEHCFFFSGVGECWAEQKDQHSEMNKELSCKGEKENSYKHSVEKKWDCKDFSVDLRI